jgi:hypothetical protein
MRESDKMERIEYEKPETPGEEPFAARRILCLSSERVGGWRRSKDNSWRAFTMLDCKSGEEWIWRACQIILVR